MGYGQQQGAYQVPQNPIGRDPLGVGHNNPPYPTDPNAPPPQRYTPLYPEGTPGNPSPGSVDNPPIYTPQPQYPPVDPYGYGQQYGGQTRPMQVGPQSTGNPNQYYLGNGYGGFGGVGQFSMMPRFGAGYGGQTGGMGMGQGGGSSPYAQILASLFGGSYGNTGFGQPMGGIGQSGGGNLFGGSGSSNPLSQGFGGSQGSSSGSSGKGGTPTAGGTPPNPAGIPGGGAPQPTPVIGGSPNNPLAGNTPSGGNPPSTGGLPPVTPTTGGLPPTGGPSPFVPTNPTGFGIPPTPPMQPPAGQQYGAFTARPGADTNVWQNGNAIMANFAQPGQILAHDFTIPQGFNSWVNFNQGENGNTSYQIVGPNGQVVYDSNKDQGPAMNLTGGNYKVLMRNNGDSAVRTSFQINHG